MKIETDNLVSIKNYSDRCKCTTSYIYKLIGKNAMTAIVIDGVKFIDITKFPKLPTQ